MGRNPGQMGEQCWQQQEIEIRVAGNAKDALAGEWIKLLVEQQGSLQGVQGGADLSVQSEGAAGGDDPAAIAAKQGLADEIAQPANGLTDGGGGHFQAGGRS